MLTNDRKADDSGINFSYLDSVRKKGNWHQFPSLKHSFIDA